jgi:hypothetical protein
MVNSLCLLVVGENMQDSMQIPSCVFQWLRQPSVDCGRQKMSQSWQMADGSKQNFVKRCQHSLIGVIYHHGYIDEGAFASRIRVARFSKKSRHQTICQCIGLERSNRTLMDGTRWESLERKNRLFYLSALNETLQNVNECRFAPSPSAAQFRGHPTRSTNT